jgi:eukaryotic-like serine/threonine-protein kinase
VDATAALLPAVIADYEVLQLLGGGGHGRCYLARPPARLRLGDEPVVLKVLAGRVGEAAFERGVQELRAVAAVRSPHVVRIFEALLQDGFAYAMEHSPLGSLADPARPLARIDILTALEHAARAAHDLHEAGIAHGGIRPGNVLFVEEAGGMLGGRLSDPGLARVLTPGAAVPGAGHTSALEFTDPDLLAGATPGRRTEVWAIGATIHRALSGASLYGELPAQPLPAIRELLSGRPRVRAGLEPAEAALVRDCIADSGARLTSAAEVADRLATLRSLP